MRAALFLMVVGQRLSDIVSRRRLEVIRRGMQLFGSKKTAALYNTVESGRSREARFDLADFDLLGLCGYGDWNPQAEHTIT